MAHMRRPHLNTSQKAALWARWKRGESLSEIGRALDRVPGAIFHVVVQHGGIPPPERTRAARVLSLAEREEISRSVAAGESVRAIGRRLGRAPSAVSRELQRHGGRDHYRATRADAAAWRAARRPKPCRLAEQPGLRQVVAAKLAADWSPEQIAGWLRVTYAGQPAMQVSHETIYRSLFVQSRGVLKKALVQHLRRVRTMRRSRHATTAGQRRGQIVDAVSIRERPATVEDWAIPGHWEGDLACRDAGRASIALSPLGPRARQRHRRGGPGVDAAGPHVAPRADDIADVGSRTRTGRPSAFYRRHRRAGLLLRSAESLATRLQRKHQRPVTPVLSGWDRPVDVFATRLESDRAQAESTSPEDLGLSHTRR